MARCLPVVGAGSEGARLAAHVRIRPVSPALPLSAAPVAFDHAHRAARPSSHPYAACLSLLATTEQCAAQMGRVCSAREISLLTVEVLERAVALGGAAAVGSR